MKTQIKYFLISLPVAAVLLLICRIFFPTPVFTVGNWLVPFGIAVVLLILFSITDRLILSLITKRKQTHERDLFTFWSELARVTGLTFNREGVSAPWNGASSQPGVSGLYQRHNASLALFTTYGDRDANKPARLFSRITFQVKNRADCSLTVRARQKVARIDREITATATDLNEGYHIAGSPSGFVMKAIQLMRQQTAFFFKKPPGRILFMNHTMLWSPGWLPPSIQIIESELICTQHGVPTDIPHQVALLELLNRLANLVEETEKGQAAKFAPEQL